MFSYSDMLQCKVKSINGGILVMLLFECAQISALLARLSSVEPRFNEIPREICSLYRKPRYNKFAKKQPKCSLYQGIVNNCFLMVLRCTTE